MTKQAKFSFQVLSGTFRYFQIYEISKALHSNSVFDFVRFIATLYPLPFFGLLDIMFISNAQLYGKEEK